MTSFFASGLASRVSVAKHWRDSLVAVVLILTFGTVQAHAQVSTAPVGNQSSQAVLERHFAIDFLHDQKDIWTSPLKLKRKDLFWVVPAGIVVGGLIYRDVDGYRAMSVSDLRAATAKTFTDVGVVALGGLTASSYFYGLLKTDSHARETGVLSTEALADAMTVNYALKYSLRRDRPTAGDGQGQFFEPGGDSFPSAHAMAAWSMAAVLAREYPGSLTKIGVYGLASAISLMRVPARQHFPSDVVVGSALGWFIGDHVYEQHHDADLPGISFGTFHNAELGPRDQGSPYVPLDSWVYPAIDRLISLGLINSAMRGMRPWTRAECYRLVHEADSPEAEDIPESARLLEELKTEFESEWNPVRLESVYARATSIQGPPLTDGYHFGETITNDFGRPYQEGFNSVVGASASAAYGHWAFYVRSEYQHAPSAPALSSTALSAEAAADFTPTLSPAAQNATNRVRLLDAYFGYTIAGWQFSVGKQSLWWGPGEEGALNFSDNAEPVPMFRVSRVTPMRLPWLLAYMGPVRLDILWGQMAGQQFVRTANGLFGPDLANQPMLHGEKISFKPTPNLEFGFSETTLWGGPGLPLDLHAFLNSYSLGNTNPGATGDPGDRRSGFDFSYQIPRLRNRMVLYSDSFSEDEFSPIAYPRKSSFRTGIYFPTLPWIHKFDFRSEGVYTDIPSLNNPGVAYSNNRFLNGYTNEGHILGDWIGREGSGFSARSTYWHSARKTITLSYRDINVNPEFIGGGRYSDIAGQVNWELPKRTMINFTSQYERWLFPALTVDRQTNVVVSAGITLWTSGK